LLHAQGVQVGDLSALDGLGGMMHAVGPSAAFAPSSPPQITRGQATSLVFPGPC
jgi:hypothetical protein